MVNPCQLPSPSEELIVLQSILFATDAAPHLCTTLTLSCLSCCPMRAQGMRERPVVLPHLFVTVFDAEAWFGMRASQGRLSVLRRNRDQSMFANCQVGLVTVCLFFPCGQSIGCWLWVPETEDGQPPASQHHTYNPTAYRTLIHQTATDQFQYAPELERRRKDLPFNCLPSSVLECLEV